MKKAKLTADACALALVFLFVYTASAKLFRVEIFEVQLERFPWIGSMAQLLSWAVPVAELIVAVLLLTGRVRRIGFYAALTLMLAFTLFLALMLATEKNLPCSCGGVISAMSWKQHLLFNIFFTGIATTGIVYSSPKIKFYEIEQPHYT